MNLKYFWVSAAVMGTVATGEAALGQPAPNTPNALPVPSAVPPPPPVIAPAPAAPPAPRTGRERPATPAGSPGNWVTTMDYPSRALREERQGVTGIRLTVGPDGSVTRCDLTLSSGSPDLDAATCVNLTARARFNPALDGNGNPTTGYWSTRVRWTIPEDGPDYLPGFDYEALPLSGTATTSMLVDRDGITSECQVTQSTGDLASRLPVGTTACAVSFFEGGYTDRRGQAVSRTVLTEQVVVINVIPERFVPSTTSQAGQNDDGSRAPAAGRVVRSYIVEVDGTQTFCQIVSASGELAGRFRVGTYTCPNVRFLSPFRDAVGRAERRQVTVTETISFAGRR